MCKNIFKNKKIKNKIENFVTLTAISAFYSSVYSVYNTRAAREIKMSKPFENWGNFVDSLLWMRKKFN